jgi:exopolysaccharide biosynthesis polyprenyl glycosylphosphotransferase
MTSLRLERVRSLILRCDAIMVLIAMAGSFSLHALLRHSFGAFRAAAGPSGFVLLAYLALPVWLLLVPLFRLDRFLEYRWNIWGIAFRLFQLHLVGFAFLTAVTFVTKIVVNRSIVITFVALAFCLLLGSRWLARSWVQAQHAKGNARRRVLLIGEPGRQMSTYLDYARKETFPAEIVGYLGQETPGCDAGFSCLGRLARLPDVLHDHAVDEVVLFDQTSQRKAGWVLHVCSDLGLSVKLALPWREIPRVQLHLESVEATPFLSFGQPAHRSAQLAVKQMLDVVLAACGIVVLSPVLGLLWLAVRLVEGKPAIFSQVRVGLHGRRFRMLKFRTMVQDAEAMRAQLEPRNEVDGPAFKVTHDPRITRLGAFLRKTSLDELPQLFNVIEGSMSLVGPRPLPESEQQRIHGAQRRRLAMKPGITGLWQVSGRSEVRFAEWMRLDQEYVDEWSLALDLRVLAATLPAVLRRKGAL